MSSTQLIAAAGLMANALFWGFGMSLRFRSKMKTKEEAEKVKATEAFQLASVAQLNNSEWAPLFIAPLLFLHLAKSGSAWTAYGSLISCIGYCITKQKLLPVPVIPFGVGRYVVFGGLIYDILQV